MDPLSAAYVTRRISDEEYLERLVHVQYGEGSSWITVSTPAGGTLEFVPQHRPSAARLGLLAEELFRYGRWCITSVQYSDVRGPDQRMPWLVIDRVIAFRKDS